MLAPARDTGAPSPLLIYGNAARTEALARLLGASVPFPAVSVVRIVQDRIDRLRDQGGSAAAAGLTEAARPFPVETFFSGRTVTPGLDEATHRHCLRVTGLAAAFATELGFGDLDGYRLTKAARPHDVEKTKIPSSVLNKPGRTARRPYRPPKSGEMACGLLRSMSGSLDPVLVEAFRPVMIAFDPSEPEPRGSGVPAR